MEEYKKIIVLGAGFSKSLCNKMPLIKDLLNDFEKDSLLEKFIYKIKDELSDFFDVENCISYILSREIFFDDKEDIEFYTLRKEILRHIYRKMIDYKPEPDKINLMKKFLHYSAKEKTLFITFNYDLFIEMICDEDKYLNLGYGIKLKRDIYSSAYNIDCGVWGSDNIQLLKLHGSFNWFNISESESEGANIDDITAINQSDNNEIFKDKVPYFVPMSNTKYNYFKGNFYKILWNKMKYYMDKVEEIDFIGYGFPKTDLDNLILFSSYKEKVKNIVIYKSEEDIKNKERLEKVFTNTNITTIGAVEYIRKLLSNTSL